MYTRFNRLKEGNPDLKVSPVSNSIIPKDRSSIFNFKAMQFSKTFFKTFISVGGWSHNLTDWSRMVSNDSGIDSFINNSMIYARENGFDGIDLDWEYPGYCKWADSCSVESDVSRFQVLLERFRDAIEAEEVNATDKMLLSAAVGISKNKIYGDNLTYNPEHLTDNLDFVNLMAYDMHGSWESETGHHTLAHALSIDDRQEGTTNVEWILDKWITLGADPSKLHLGEISLTGDQIR